MNLRHLTDALLTQEIKTLKVKLAPYTREQSRRKREAVKAIRPAKVKVRKVRSEAEKERERKYAEFREVHTWCWACGRDKKPPKWYEPWLPNERAHIVNKPRVEDVRAVVSLCTICHRISHWERFAHFKEPSQLTTGDLIRLKREHDPDNYDPEFLQRHSVRKLCFPRPS